MELIKIIDYLKLKLLTDPENIPATDPTIGYTSDLLSCVMAGAKQGCLWVTLQAHLNIVAVAALLDITAIIITEGAQPDTNTLKKANEQSITILWTEQPSFWVAGKLWELGIRSE